MEYIIAESRLENLLQRDKSFDMTRVCEVLKGEISPIAQQYLTLCQPLVVRFKKEGEKLCFKVNEEGVSVRRGDVTVRYRARPAVKGEKKKYSGE